MATRDGAWLSKKEKMAVKEGIAGADRDTGKEVYMSFNIKETKGA
jgi:hypothetical protein